MKCRPNLFALASIAMFAALPTFADVQPTDDVGEAATIETNQSVRFTVPAHLRPAVVYRMRLNFESDREQTVTLYVWAQDDDTRGHWERRAFYNTHFNGRSVNAELALDPGRTYLMAAHHKHVRGPGFGQPWYQSKLVARPAPAQSPAPAPAPVLAARFTGGPGTAVDVSLVPLEVEGAHDAAGAD